MCGNKKQAIKIVSHFTTMVPRVGIIIKMISLSSGIAIELQIGIEINKLIDHSVKTINKVNQSDINPSSFHLPFDESTYSFIH
jgi:hypothetical protein